MKVEEDLVNLSDLGNGPEKPTIKTIYKKMKEKEKEEKEKATPNKTPSKTTLSPESRKTIENLKQTPESYKSKVSGKKSPNNLHSKGYDSDGISEYSDNFDQSKLEDYTPESDFINYPLLTKEPNFTIK